MARFNFRLETLRRLREVDRDEARGRLATAYEAERILADQRAAVAAEGTALAEMRRALMTQPTVDVNRLLSAQRYQLSLEAQEKTMAAQAAKLAEEVDRRRQAVVEADRQVRTLDRLEDRQLQQHRLTEQRTEAKRIDEIAVTRWEVAEPWA